MALYFIRHGESNANEQNRFAGHLESHLTALGERQARDAGRRTRQLGIEFDEVHVSTLSRTHRTADLALAELGQEPARVESGLIVERHFGVFGGRNKSLVKKSVGYAKYTEYFHSNAGSPPGGETWEELYGRVRDYYDDVLLPAHRAGKNVLVVTHKYVVEMFALVVGDVSPDDYRDLKVPNATPLSEADLRRLSQSGSSSAAVNDLGEMIEIRFPLLAFAAVLVGVGLGLLVDVTLPTALFETGLAVFLGVASFFTWLRIAPSLLTDPNLRPSRRSAALILPLVLVRAIGAVVILTTLHSPMALLAALLLLLPPALLAPTLSLSWGGDYFAAVCQTVVSTLVLPLLVLGAVLLDGGTAISADRLPTAALSFGLVVACSFALPLIVAQLVRRSNPIQAGKISTNWNWLGPLSLICLAFFAGFALTPRGLPLDLVLLGQIGFVVAGLIVLRVLAGVFLVFVMPREGIDRDVRITQGTPNVFLWVSLSAALFGASEAAFGVAVMVVFFGFLFADDAIRVRRERRDVRRAIREVVDTRREPVLSD